MSQKISNKSLWNLLIIFSFVGIFLAVYLLLQYYKPVASGVCNLNSRFNCNAITKTELGYILGVPIAAIGLVGYLFILFFGIIKNKALSVFMSAFGFFFCLRITILEVFFVDVMCPVCIMCQINMAILLIISLVLGLQKKRSEEKK